MVGGTHWNECLAPAFNTREACTPKGIACAHALLDALLVPGQFLERGRVDDPAS